MRNELVKAIKKVFGKYTRISDEVVFTTYNKKYAVVNGTNVIYRFDNYNECCEWLNEFYFDEIYK